MLTITRRLEFDAGHRIANHRGACAHMHGHRYALELTLVGEVNSLSGEATEGMLLDFSQVKRLAQRHLVDLWDHAFLVHREDSIVLDFLTTIPGHKTVVLDCVPTVENLARLAYHLLTKVIHTQCQPKVQLARVRMYETPNCWADFCLEQEVK